MSRCYPFPPPGYDEKARIDDVELPVKEKHKEEKHKKNKDKKKKEHKDKKDKERSKDKHKEKKERKEKHKSKKEDKDGDRERSIVSDDRKDEGRIQNWSDEKPSEIGCHINDQSQRSIREELGKQNRDEAKTVQNQVCEDFAGQVQRRVENMFGTPDKRRSDSQVQRRVENMFDTADQRRSNSQVQRLVENMFDTADQRSDSQVQRKLENNFGTPDQRSDSLVQRKVQNMFGSLDQKNSDGQVQRMVENIFGTPDQIRSGSQVQRMVENVFGTADRRRSDIVARSMEKHDDICKEGGKREGENRIEERLKDKVEVKINGYGKGQNNLGTNQSIGMMGDQKTLEGKGNRKHEGDGEKKNKHRHKDKEKKSKRKDKNEKEEGKVKDKGADRHKELAKVGECQNGQIEKIHVKPQFPPKDSKDGEKSSVIEGSLKKRKDSETNGFVHENDLQPNKLPRLASASPTILENGRKLESSHITIRCVSDRQGKINRRKEEGNKEHKVNGLIEAKVPKTISKGQVTLGPHVDGEASTQPPHPDTMYLSQLLSIPKNVEWPDSDDLDWLFSANTIHSMSEASSRASASGASEIPQVWAGALWIEAADVNALPYVIPY